MIVVLDYGMGNLSSVEKALRFLNKDFIISNDHDIIKNSKILIIPGVGSFQQGMENIRKLNLVQVISEKIEQSDSKIIGICLGMQLLATYGNEPVKTKGLDLIEGEVFLINKGKVKRVPHLGWNNLTRCQGIMSEFENDDFYFIHSYVFLTLKQKDTIAFANYEDTLIPAVVHHKNVYGFQFHPEKSQNTGMKLLKKILDA